MVALLGYTLANGNMALWAMTVVSSLLTSIPNGVVAFHLLLGDFVVSAVVLPRAYTIHFSLGLALILAILAHLSAVHSAESTTDLKIRAAVSNLEFLGSALFKDILTKCAYL